MFTMITMLLVVCLFIVEVSSFTISPTHTLTQIHQHGRNTRFSLASLPPENDRGDSQGVVDSVVGKEVQELLARAKAIRDSLPPDDDQTSIQVRTKSSTDVNVETSSENNAETSSIGYRLYVDIGREDGTWMNPKWGASGKRIEFTIDTFFHVSNSDGEDLSLADDDVVAKMVKDNLSGKSSSVRKLDSPQPARLRGGFDQMKCSSGGYRIDVGKGSTVRFFLDVEGTPEISSSYGDINIPKGCLYFSLPCFIVGKARQIQLSKKEGIVSVRQKGWHSGWWREESRIAGVFRAVPIEEARKRDRF